MRQSRRHWLENKILFLKNEDFNSKVIAKRTLRSELREDRESTGRFNIDYLPTCPGTYDFLISGTINYVYILLCAAY